MTKKEADEKWFKEFKKAEKAGRNVRDLGPRAQVNFLENYATWLAKSIPKSKKYPEEVRKNDETWRGFWISHVLRGIDDRDYVVDKNSEWTEPGFKPQIGSRILSFVGDTAAELFIPYLAKKGTEAGRYYASEFMRNPKLQKKAINWGIKKATPVIQKVGSKAINQLSTKVRPNYKYKTDRMDLNADTYKGSGIPLPFPYVDWKGAKKVLTDPTLIQKA